jgi:hypothetical protein
VGLHEKAVPGSERMLRAFSERGCPSSHKLVEVGRAGRYVILCQEKTARVARERARQRRDQRLQVDGGRELMTAGAGKQGASQGDPHAHAAGDIDAALLVDKKSVKSDR